MSIWHKFAWYVWRRDQLLIWLQGPDFPAGVERYRLARQLVATNLAGMRDHPELAREMVAMVRQAERRRANGRWAPCIVCEGKSYIITDDRLVNCCNCRGTGKFFYPRLPNK